jgi:CheY-like chemotaxis protein
MSEIKRMLLVEDDPHDLEMTLLVLKKNNLRNEIQIARDGEEALHYLYHQLSANPTELQSLAVILLDLKLPKIDGIEVLRQIRADERLKMIPVVMLTSSREERDLIEAYKLGVNAYVVKPLNFREFADTIKGVGLFWTIINEPPPGGNRSGGQSE